MTKCYICKKKTKLFTIKKKQPLTIYPKKNFNTIKYRDLSLFFCSRCDHLIQSPKPNNKTLNSIYNSDQSNYTSMLKSSKIIQARENLKINNLINVLKKKIILHNSNILEIGGYDGFTLTKLFRYTKNLYLVEPNKKACKLAKKNKINVINDAFPSKKINQKFDVIIMRHVIEHLPNISKLQSSLKKILKDNGVIVIETPELICACDAISMIV